ncbi:TPA: hypothetical protein U0V61_005049 [Escherichia coli]|nr:hypothetical protein [Escherichia coli]HAY0218982.1 hypothetical protein [Escherichia coli]HAY0228596.1 hypothetical protein [Escherichia coli]HAY0385856.1 hypothetical protein [Escherichia coli]HEL7978403.1 hypothetical protein [Escherichia coli]
MGGPVDWDTNLLAPLFGVFGEACEYRSRRGGAYLITGIYDRAYTQQLTGEDGGMVSVSTFPVLGVRDADFVMPPAQGDSVMIIRTGELFTVRDVQPDSHGGTRLELNRVK